MCTSGACARRWKKTQAPANLKAHARVFARYAELSLVGNALARRFSQEIDASVQILDVNGTVVGDSGWPEERAIARCPEIFALFGLKQAEGNRHSGGRIIWE